MIRLFNKQKFVLFFTLLLVISVVNASEMEEIERGEQLVKSRVSCSTLDYEQLENIGEYYMELMHPGELHEIIDQRMGGEGSETLEQAHINIAKMMYCGERNALPIGMMNIMMNRNSFGGMMGFGSRYGMMSNFGNTFLYGGGFMLFWILILGLIVYFIYWLTKNNFEIKRKRR